MRLTDRALNRALLARQGLIEPFDAPVVDVVEAIGALQAQHWPALPEAMWSRMRGFTADDLYGALDAGDLVMGTSIRRTLHLVSAREHASYAMVAETGGVNDWQRSTDEPTAEAQRLRAELLTFAGQPRTGDELAAFIEEWVDAHPEAFDEAELTAQRQYKWRSFYTWSALVRVPADGTWSPKTPAAYRTAPCPPTGSHAPDPDDALADVIRCHLRAFGPAAADDVATWLAWKTPPVRQALERLAPTLERFTDGAERTLYDVKDAPRPDPDVAAPVRFLPSFDSTLLAYAHRHRQRILPEEHKDKVYARANLRVRPTFLVDGLVAGLWSAETKRRTATLTVTPFGPLDEATRAAVVAEAERLVRANQPAAKDHEVTVASPLPGMVD